MTDAVQIELIRGAVTITGNFVIATPAIIAAYLSWRSLRRVGEVHDQGERNYAQMNGRMEEMLKLKGEASEATGQQKERDRREEAAPAEMISKVVVVTGEERKPGVTD